MVGAVGVHPFFVVAPRRSPRSAWVSGTSWFWRRARAPVSDGVSRRAVFLDRDGVLNAAFVRDGVPTPPRSIDEFRILDGVPETCAALREAGWLLVVVTNQPDIARGRIGVAQVSEINARLRSEVDLDEVVVCPHDEKDGCLCRKPGDGMLRDAARRWDVSLTRSFMVGDRWRDIGAGRRAGCRTILIDRGYDEVCFERPDFVVRDLPEVLPIVLQTRGS